jgi:hypothetical protein
MSGRFQKGQSGNPAGRPKARRPHVSAFDVIFDKTLTVTQNGVERELTVTEALQLQTYHAALNGSKMAVRAVLKMIEKREAALARAAPPAQRFHVTQRREIDPRNADEAMLLLGITLPDPRMPERCKYGLPMKMATWATQAGISRPGRGKLSQQDVDNIKREAVDADKLKWPRGVLR